MLHVNSTAPSVATSDGCLSPTLPWEIVKEFERCVAAFAGAKYGVAVDTCTWALFLCLKWCRAERVSIPRRTYIGVPCYIRHAGASVVFDDRNWGGEYVLEPYPIIDSACRFRRGMHIPGTFRCVSFNARKHLPILCGRGGMILHDDPQADRWLRRARFLGRGEVPLSEDVPEFIGWHCFMEPARAADGLQRLSLLPTDRPADLVFHYPDLSAYGVYDRENPQWIS